MVDVGDMEEIEIESDEAQGEAVRVITEACSLAQTMHAECDQDAVRKMIEAVHPIFSSNLTRDCCVAVAALSVHCASLFSDPDVAMVAIQRIAMNVFNSNLERIAKAHPDLSDDGSKTVN